MRLNAWTHFTKTNLIALFAVSLFCLACDIEDSDGLADDPNDLVWRDGDAEIRIRYFSYWTGGHRYRATLDTLTEEQLEILRSIELTTNGQECWEDVGGYRVEILDADGEVREYQAGFEDSVCDGPDQVISMESLQEFTGTYSCLSAGATRHGNNTLESALTIDVDPGCFHGFFGGPIWLQLDIDEPGTYMVQEGTWSPDCTANEVTIAVYSEDGATLLAEGSHDDATDCWSVEHQFEAAGTYFLRIEGVMGDYFVNVSSLED